MIYDKSKDLFDELEALDNRLKKMKETNDSSLILTEIRLSKKMEQIKDDLKRIEKTQNDIFERASIDWDRFEHEDPDISSEIVDKFLENN